jgi:beta-carotene hydroxylase
MLKYQADLRTVFFMMITTGLLVLLWLFGATLNWWVWVPLYLFQLLMSVSVSVMTHNHKHLSMWKSKFMNIITDNWLTMFYGFPVFGWEPTHMNNHHVHVNTEEDYTRTHRFTEKNNLFTLLTYPTVSSRFQLKHVIDFFTSRWHVSKSKFFFNTLQIICLIIFIVIALILDWQKALLYVIIPQQVSVYSVLIFNYVQHVHADEETKYNNSRNMTGVLMNFFLINNGYHTAHHISPGAHWSKLKEKHYKLVDKIDPSLNESNFGWYLLRTFILSIFIPKYRSKSMRLERISKQQRELVSQA